MLLVHVNTWAYLNNDLSVTSPLSRFRRKGTRSVFVKVHLHSLLPYLSKQPLASHQVRVLAVYIVLQDICLLLADLSGSNQHLSDLSYNNRLCQSLRNFLLVQLFILDLDNDRFGNSEQLDLFGLIFCFTSHRWNLFKF